MIRLLRASEEHIDRNSDFPEVAHDFYFPSNQLNSIYCKLQQYIGFKVTNFDFSDRSSHQRCSIKKGVLRNFAKFTGKHLCQSLFFNKIAVAGEMNFSRTPEHNINFLTTDDLKVLNISFIIGVSLLHVNLSIALINANAFM